MTNPVRSEEIIHLARSLYEMLIGLPLSEAEADLEDCRKILWVAAFSGVGLADVAAHHGRTAAAREMAERLGVLPLLTIEAVLQEARFGLYINAFGRDPGSRFGGFLAAHVATADADPGVKH